MRVSVEGVGRGCEGECGFQFLAASNSTISVDRCVCVHACLRVCVRAHAVICVHLWYSDVLCVSCPGCGSHVWTANLNCVLGHCCHSPC